MTIRSGDLRALRGGSFAWTDGPAGVILRAEIFGAPTGKDSLPAWAM